jgi:hypothetical protein
MIEALIYGAIPSANTENLLRAPPENIFRKLNISEVGRFCVRSLASTPGVGICVPILNTKIMPRVKRIRFLSSGIFMEFDRLCSN